MVQVGVRQGGLIESSVCEVLRRMVPVVLEGQERPAWLEGEPEGEWQEAGHRG